MDKLNPWEYDDNYLKSCTGQASMDSITYSSHVNILFFFPPSTEAARRRERSRHWNTQRYPKTYRSNTFLRETNFESDTTPKIHFSMWRALNKSNSMVCDSNGKWMHDYLSVRAKGRNTRGLWRKGVQRPDPSVPWRGQVTSVLKWRSVGVTSSRSELDCQYPSRCPPQVMHVAEMITEGTDTDPDLGQKGPPYMVGCTRPCACPCF